MRRAAGYILGSNLVAQLFLLSSTPFLTRIYTKADFGWFGVGTTIAILLATLMSMRLEHSIHLHESTASSVYRSCLMIISLSTVCFFVPVLLFFKVTFISQQYINSWWVLLFGFGHATHASTTLFLNSRHRFKSIALVNILIPVVFVTGSLFFSKAFPTANGLLAWQAIAFAVGAFVGVVLNISSMGKWALAESLALIKTERRGMLYLVPSSLLSTLTLNLPVLFSIALFSDTAAGLVVIAQRIARTPISVIGNGLNEVLRSTIPDRVRIYSTFQRVAIACLILSLIMLLTTWMVPESVYLFVFGDQWTGIKIVLFATVFGAVFQLAGTSVICLLSSFGKKQEFYVNVWLLFAGVFAAGVSIVLSMSNLNYLWMHVLFSAAVYIFAFMLARKVALANKPG